MLDTLLQDIKYATRTLRNSPGFTVAAVLTLAAGIGANTAIFSVLNGVLLRPLPYKDAGRLAALWTDDPKHDIHEEGVAYPNFEDWRKMSSSFEDMAICSRSNPVVLTGGQEPERIESAVVSANFFSVMGVPPSLGRIFSPDEVRTGEHVVVLSDGLWKRRFGGSADALGKTLEVDGAAWKIIGVMPPGFGFPTVDVQFWEQITAFSRWRGIQRQRYSDWGRVVGRLKRGVTPAQAQTEMNAISKRLELAYPATGAQAADFAGFGVTLVPLMLQITGKQLPLALWMLFGAVLLVLLIACANVANLLMARGSTRAREIAIRQALGAAKRRLLRQLLTESLLLAGVAGALGVALAAIGVPALIALAPRNLPRLNEVRLDPGVLAFSIGISLLAGVLFGLAPMLRLSQMASGLNRRSSNTGRGGAKASSVLVIAEFALSATLLCGAGLMVHSLLRLQAVNPGFRPERVLTMRMASSAKDPVPFYSEVLQQVSALPGVQTAGLIEDVLQRRNPDYVIKVMGRSDQMAEPVSGDAVSPACFEALGVQLLKGRWFSDQDRSGPAVAIVNETMVQHFWPGQDALGRRFREADERPNHPWYTVVGVVRDMRRTGLERQPIAQIFWPYFQRPSWTTDLVIRTTSDPGMLAKAVRQQIREVDKTVAVFQVSTLERRLDESLSPRRFQSFLLSMLSILGLGLSAIGIYGLMHYVVAQRTQEIGIRMALGARASDVLRMVILRGLLLAFIGLAAGIGGALAITRVLSALLFGVRSVDPATFIGAPILIVMVAVLACAIPAWRAARIDPLTALRHE